MNPNPMNAGEEVRIQFIFACEHPVSNVRMYRRKGAWIFEVPVNFPDIHKLTLRDLLALSVVTEDVHTVHNP